MWTQLGGLSRYLDSEVWYLWSMLCVKSPIRPLRLFAPAHDTLSAAPHLHLTNAIVALHAMPSLLVEVQLILPDVFARGAQ